MFKKADFYLIIILLAVCAACVFSFMPKIGRKISVYVDGEEYCQASLAVDQTIELPNASLEIKSGQVRMVQAECPDQICVKQGAISAGSLICLPNRIVVQVLADDLDAVVGR